MDAAPHRFASSSRTVHLRRLWCSSGSSAEKAIAGVAETRKDVSVVVEMPVDRAGERAQPRMGVVQRLRPFRSGDDANETQVFDDGAAGQQQVDRCDCGTARREHRIEYERAAAVQIVRQVHVVRHRAQRVGIAKDADVRDLRLRHQRMAARHESQARAQDRDEQRHAPERSSWRPVERRRDLGRGRFEIGGRGKREQRRKFRAELAEFFIGRRGIAQPPELVVHERMIDECQTFVHDATYYGTPNWAVRSYTRLRRRSTSLRLDTSSIAAPMMLPISDISASFMPRVVIAGVPIRTPLATAGGFLSNGIVFLLTVMPISSRYVSTSLPVKPRTDTSTSIK